MIENIVTRIIAILETINDLTTVSDEYPSGKLQIDDLPYVVVTDGEAPTYERFNNDALLITRNFYIEVFWEKSKPDTLGDKTPRQAVRPIIETVPLLFERRRRLEFNGVGLSQVLGVTIASDDGAGYGGFNAETYVGTRFTLAVQYFEEL